MGYLNPACFLSLDILDRTQYQGPFSVDQMSQWTFWTRPMFSTAGYKREMFCSLLVDISTQMQHIHIRLFS